jgi:hypothetical protein
VCAVTMQGTISPERRAQLRTASRRAKAADDRAAVAKAELRALVAAAMTEGASLRTVSAATGLSTTTLQKWLREMKEKAKA